MIVPPSVQMADELWASMHPVQVGNDEEDTHLATYTYAAAMMLADTEDLVRDGQGEDGTERPGWAILFEPYGVPIAQLGFTAQFVGVRLLQGLDEESQRDRVASTDGFQRGTVSAMKAAAGALLTGGKRVVLRERYDPANPTDDSPYHLHVTTYTAETPDPVTVEAALVAQKPGGIVLHYEVADGQDYQNLLDNNPTYQDVKDNFTDYEDVRSNI